MKTFKLTKGVQIILVTLLVLIVGIITVGVWANDETMAATPTCTNCGSAGTKEYKDDEYHQYKCPDCGRWLGLPLKHSSTGEPIEDGEYVDNGDETHYATYECNECGHEYINKEVPIDCTWETCTTSGVSSFAKYHKYLCKYCGGDSHEVPHEITTTYYNENVHRIDCNADCGYWANESHNPDEFGCEECQKSGGDCPVAGCDGTLIWRNLGETGHIRICTNDGCTSNLSYRDEPIPHVYTDGICFCGATNSELTLEGESNGCGECRKSTIKYIDSMFHQISCSCGTFVKPPEQHTNNNGKCACGYVYPTTEDSITCCENGKSIKIIPSKSNANKHFYGCDACGFVYYSESHVPNDTGVCTTCGYDPTKSEEENEEGSAGCKHENVVGGYSGGKYVIQCTDCDLIIAEETFPGACTEDNHVPGNITLTAAGHNMSCACGELKNQGPHEWLNGKCSVCQYPDPNASEENPDGGTENPGTGATPDSGTPGGNPGGGNPGGGNTGGSEGEGEGEGEEGENGDTECQHTYETYTVNEDGTHSSTCTKCEYELKEAHKYENGKCVCGAEEVLTEEKLEVTSEKYTIKDSYIAKVSRGTTITQLKANIVHNAAEIKIYTRNSVLVDAENTKMATGMKIDLKKGKETKTFTIVVTGDVDGDAEVDLRDFLAINKHRLRKAELTNEFLLAGDVNFDGKADLKDILQINKFRLGKINEL